MKKNTKYIVKSAVIGAFYAAVTLALAPISFGAVQLRVSEALTILPMFIPEAIPGLFIGCIISNAVGMAMGANVAGAFDILFGSLATLIAAILTRKLKDIRIHGLPLLSLLPPIIFNAFIIGAELTMFLPQQMSFIYSAISVGAGEAVAVFALGIPLYYVLKKTKLFERL